MNAKTDIVHPHHCFCEVPEAELRPWVEKRYIEEIPTIKLLHSTDDPHQREIISIVALLDVDEGTSISRLPPISTAMKFRW